MCVIVEARKIENSALLLLVQGRKLCEMFSSREREDFRSRESVRNRRKKKKSRIRVKNLRDVSLNSSLTLITVLIITIRTVRQAIENVTLMIKELLLKLNKVTATMTNSEQTSKPIKIVQNAIKFMVDDVSCFLIDFLLTHTIKEKEISKLAKKVVRTLRVEQFFATENKVH